MRFKKIIRWILFIGIILLLAHVVRHHRNEIPELAPINLETTTDTATTTKPNIEEHVSEPLPEMVSTTPGLPETTPPPRPLVTPEETLAEKLNAVAVTNAACKDLGDMYWVIGDKHGEIVSGTVGTQYTGTKEVKLASAAKWLFSAYALEKVGGTLSPDLIKGLNFTSGHVSQNTCFPFETIGKCFNRGNNNEYNASYDGVFYYAAGHMQSVATNILGIGDMRASEYATALSETLNLNPHISSTIPLMSGAGSLTPDAYGRFLQSILQGKLLIGGYLGAYAHCGNPTTCPNSAAHSPIPETDTWSYSLGHWVESGPDAYAAYSSPGAFGFYPWISKDKKYWGLLVRESKSPSAYWDSAVCGKEIRTEFIKIY